MPDVTLIVRDFEGPEDAEKLERALSRINGVNLVNADAEKGLVAVSYDGGGPDLGDIEDAIREAGHDPEPTPGAEAAGD